MYVDMVADVEVVMGAKMDLDKVTNVEVNMVATISKKVSTITKKVATITKLF